MLPAPSQGMQPGAGDFLAEGAQAAAVAMNRVVVEVALNNAPQPLTNHGDRLAHAAFQLLSQRFERGTHSLARSQPIHDEPTARLLDPTDMGEARKSNVSGLLRPEPARCWAATRPNSNTRIRRLPDAAAGLGSSASRAHRLVVGDYCFRFSFGMSCLNAALCLATAAANSGWSA